MVNYFLEQYKEQYQEGMDAFPPQDTVLSGFHQVPYGT